MVYKIIYKFLIIFIFFIFKTNLLANVVYNKDNIIISELDLNYYKQIHYEKFNEKINSPKAIKNLVKIEKLINSLEKNNPNFLKKIDNNIENEIGKENIISELVLDIIRYLKVRNEFVYDFYNNSFQTNDLNYIFSSFDNLELPISKNNCLTITKIVNLKNNSEFKDIFFENMKKEKKIYELSIDNSKYNVCINQRNAKIIEKEIFNYIELKIHKDFEKFVYENQNR